MTLADLSSLGGFISGVAVLISLVYLSLQIRQNAKHTRALIQQGRIDRITNHQMMMADSDLVAAWLVGNGVAVTPEAVRERQFQQQLTSYYIGWDDTLSQYHDGLVSEEQFARFRRQMINLVKTSPGMRGFLSRSLVVTGSAEDRLLAFTTDILAAAAESEPQ